MKKYRQKEGLFLLEGKRAVEEALASGWTIRALFFTRLPEGWEQQAENSSLPWYEVPLPVLQKITATEDPPERGGPGGNCVGKTWPPLPIRPSGTNSGAFPAPTNWGWCC